MTNLYRRGRIAERKIVNDLIDKGFENICRSKGSRGPADIYAVRDGVKHYIQVKSGSARASAEEIERLRELAQQRRGKAVIIYRKDGKINGDFTENGKQKQTS